MTAPSANVYEWSSSACIELFGVEPFPVIVCRPTLFDAIIARPDMWAGISGYGSNFVVNEQTLR